MQRFLPFLFTLAKEDSEWRFESAQQPYVAPLIILGVIAFVVVAYLLEPRTEGRTRGGRVVLGFFRALALLVGIAILFHPVERKETREVKDGYVVLVIDKSRSMSLKDREGDQAYLLELAQKIGVPYADLKTTDRLTRVKKALSFDPKGGTATVLERFAEKNKVKVYTFDAGRLKLCEIDKIDKDALPREKDEKGDGEKKDEKPTPEASLARGQQLVNAIEPDGLATALPDSLQKILTDLRSDKVAALVLLTDGRSNAGSLSAEVVAARYHKKNIPILAVGVGDPNPPKDLSIENLEAPEVTLVNDIVPFQCLVRAQGYPARRDVDLELVVEGQVLKHEKVELGGDKTETTKTITWKPEKEGEFDVELRIPPDDQEITVENNKAFHHLRVIAEKIKVLYIEGYPRWEYRYFMNAMKRDAKVELQCFLLSADAAFPQESSKGVPSLRAFPTAEELKKYHVIVFGDVSPQAQGPDGRPFFPEGTFEAIKEFVADEGGGFLMISGEQDSPRRYASTPIGPLLPIQVDEQEGTVQRDLTESWRPRLTREGMRTPLLRLEPDEQRNKALWEGTTALPGFFWYTRALKVKPRAHVLAEHPTERNQDGNFPIFAWQDYKSGTVFWSAVDETWRWRAGVGDKFMYRFWGQVLRFLAHGRFQRSKRFTVTTDKSKYNVGEDVQIQAVVHDRRSGPATEKTQEVVIERPDAQTEKLELKLLEGKAGTYEGRYRPLKIGIYKVSIDPGATGSEGDVAPKLFEVKFPSIELEEPRMDKDGLEALSRASGGEFLRLDK
ncbi:hypothetical protein HY251_10940, partial [bacterium]|nr:hypothetical protein [bacterium]